MTAPDQPRRPLAPLPEGEGGQPAIFDPAPPAEAPAPAAPASAAKAAEPKASPDGAPREIGGRQGPEPTRYGDWEKNGIISDF